MTRNKVDEAKVKIVTNGQERLILDWNQLTKKEQAQFDYLSEDSRIDRDFVRFKRYCYDLGEFMGTRHFKGWDGYQADSYSSGVLVRYCKDDRDRVVMATYYS